MLQLRPYQREALDNLYAYWEEGLGNGLIVLPTGAGKALVLAKLIEELLADYPDMRIINVTHSATLVEQNFKEFIGLVPFAPAGIYSAGLGRRDAHAQVIFGGIQSMANKTDRIGDVDLVIVDEAHAISRNADTLYSKFFSAIRARNPDFRTVGLTATDYRMDSGRLTEGEDRLFDDVVYEIGIGELMEQGYLTRLTSQKNIAKIDLKGINTRGGEYVPGQMSEAAERIIEEAIAEDMISSVGRRAGLFFCASQANAVHARDAIRRHGRTAEALTSDTPASDQARILADFKSGKCWALVSVNMIYTGANFPWVDFISLLFGSKSAGKIVQALGRGTRNFPGKLDCLVADHGRNLAYFGPIDQIKPRDPTSGEGEQPKKLCPQDGSDADGKTGCGELLPISIMTCPCCGYIFPPSEEEKITATADNAPVLSTERPWHAVDGRTFAHHPGKLDENGNPKPPTVKMTLKVGKKSHNKWYCPEHSGYARGDSDRFWTQHLGKRPLPSTVEEFLDRADELLATTEVQLDYSGDGKYPKIVGFRVGEGSYVTAAEKSPTLGSVLGRPATGNLSGIRETVTAMRSDDHAAKERARLSALALEMDGIEF